MIVIPVGCDVRYLKLVLKKPEKTGTFISEEEPFLHFFTHENEEWFQRADYLLVVVVEIFVKDIICARKLYFRNYRHGRVVKQVTVHS